MDQILFRSWVSAGHHWADRFVLPGVEDKEISQPTILALSIDFISGPCGKDIFSKA